MDITTSIYNYLNEQTNNMRGLVEELAKLEDDAASGKYSQDFIRDNINPRINELRKQIDGQADAAIQHAKGMVADYRADVAAANVLKANELTDDVKLLNCGVKLNGDDIVSIMQRNRNNHTMLVLCSRYAKEHDLDLGPGAVYPSRAMAECVALSARLNETLGYYRSWIGKNNASQMLNRFFGL